MKKIKKTKAENIYMFRGRSNANSCFIEKLEHGTTFLKYANYFLKDYVKVYDYIITKDGWALILKINSNQKIAKVIQQDDFETWRIISRQMRLFLSTFVTVTNRTKGRTGCLVHSSYERYFFESLEEAMKHINDIRQQRSQFYSGKKKYRGLKVHYTIERSIGKGSIFLCSRDIRRIKNKGLSFADMLWRKAVSKVVLQKMVNNTINTHSTLKTQNSNQFPLII